MNRNRKMRNDLNGVDVSPLGQSFLTHNYVFESLGIGMDMRQYSWDNGLIHKGTNRSILLYIKNLKIPKSFPIPEGKRVLWSLSSSGSLARVLLLTLHPKWKKARLQYSRVRVEYKRNTHCQGLAFPPFFLPSPFQHNSYVF